MYLKVQSMTTRFFLATLFFYSSLFGAASSSPVSSVETRGPDSVTFVYGAGDNSFQVELSRAQYQRAGAYWNILKDCSQTPAPVELPSLGSSEACRRLCALLQDPDCVASSPEERTDIDRVQRLVRNQLSTFFGRLSAEQYVDLISGVEALGISNDAGIAVAVCAHDAGLLDERHLSVPIAAHERMVALFKKYYLSNLLDHRAIRAPRLSYEISIRDVRQSGCRPDLFEREIAPARQDQDPVELDLSRLSITSLTGIETIPHLPRVTTLILRGNHLSQVDGYVPEVHADDEVNADSSCSDTDSYSPSTDLSSDSVDSDRDSDASSDDESPVDAPIVPHPSAPDVAAPWFAPFLGSEGLTLLTTIDLSNNRLQQVPVVPSTLRNLNLRNNEIEDITHLLAVRQLRNLDVRGNKISAADVRRIGNHHWQDAQIVIKIMPQYSSSYIGKRVAQIGANAAVVGGLIFAYKKFVL